MQATMTKAAHERDVVAPNMSRKRDAERRLLAMIDLIVGPPERKDS